MQKRLLPLYLTVFLDLLGVGIIIPILAPLILDPNTNLVSFSTLPSTRTIVLGCLIAAYPFAQFFGAPILGALSDRHGRKKLLFLSLIGTCIGYILFAIGIMTQQLWLMVVARLIDGFTGGNISIAQSAIADVSTPETKARNFGMIGMMFGLGFILGPFIGGKLADPSVVSWFNFSTPFYFAAGLSLLNIVLLMALFQETFTNRRNVPISVSVGFKNILRALKMEHARTMFLVMFLLVFGFNFFTQFFQVYLIGTFHFTQSQIGDMFAYIGIWIAVTQGVAMQPLTKRFTSHQILSVSIVVLSIALALILVPRDVWLLYMVIPLMSIANGLTHPNASAIISGLAGKDEQGEVLGVLQSVQSLGMVLPPLIAGFIVSIDKHLPIVVASISTLIAWMVFMSFKRRVQLPVADKNME